MFSRLIYSVHKQCRKRYYCCTSSDVITALILLLVIVPVHVYPRRSSIIKKSRYFWILVVVSQEWGEVRKQTNININNGYVFRLKMTLELFSSHYQNLWSDSFNYDAIRPQDTRHKMMTLSILITCDDLRQFTTQSLRKAKFNLSKENRQAFFIFFGNFSKTIQ